MGQHARRTASLQDFSAIPARDRFHELIDGQIIEKALPSGEHGDAQAGIAANADQLGCFVFL